MYNENFGYYISIIYRHMQIHLNKQLDEYGFGSGQYLYLIHVATKEGITQKELSGDLAIDKGTTAKAICKLIEQGYIYTKENRKDGRSHKLYLTKSGKNIVPKVRRILNNTSKILKANMDSIEEFNTLNSLKKIASNIIVKE